MGRPKKIDSENGLTYDVLVEDTIENENLDVDKTQDIKMEKDSEIEIFKKMLEEERNNNKLAMENMQKMLKEMSVSNTNSNNTLTKNEYNPMRMVKVISLVPNKLCLTTESKGMGKVIEFTKFGQARDIQYSILSDIVRTQESFAESGVFYICDNAFVVENGLSDSYKEIITYDVMKNLLNLNKKEFVSIIHSVNETQFDIIFQIFIDTLKADKTVEEDKVIAFQKEYTLRKGEKVDIEEIVENMKELSKKP